MDANNDFLWRFNRQRLDAEEIRDAMLAVSGALDPTMGGDHPFPPQKRMEILAAQTVRGGLRNESAQRLFDATTNQEAAVPRSCSTARTQMRHAGMRPLARQPIPSAVHDE